MNLGHRIYYFVSRYDKPDGDYLPPIHSIEAHSDGEARIILGEFLHVTALSLVDVTNYSNQESGQ